MNITWRPEAEVPLLGSRFVNDVISLLNHLVFAPRAHPRLPLEHYSYALIYTADEAELVLIALTHTSRRRSSWRNRLT